MRKGKSLQELAVELQRQLDTKADFVCDTRELSMHTPNGGSTLQVQEIDEFAVSDFAHGQIASRLKMPKPYYDRLRSDHQALLDISVNTLMYDKPERRMVRTLDGNVRAFLSDRYRRIDNWDLMEAVLPIINEADDMQVVSCEITDKKLYLKAVFPRVTAEVKLNDPVQAGIIIQNSEIGAGALQVSPLIYRLVCLNGMVSTEGVNKYHLGKRVEDNEAAYALFSEQTMQADDRALFLKVQDVVRATMDETKFNGIVVRLRESTERGITVGPIEAVQQLSNKLTLSDNEGDSILKHLITGGDMSQYGLIQAVTRMSQDVEDYDRATELEEMGGVILDGDRSFLTAIGITA